MNDIEIEGVIISIIIIIVATLVIVFILIQADSSATFKSNRLEKAPYLKICKDAGYDNVTSFTNGWRYVYYCQKNFEIDYDTNNIIGDKK